MTNKQLLYYIADIAVLGGSVLSAGLGFTDHAIAGIAIYLTGQRLQQIEKDKHESK